MNYLSYILFINKLLIALFINICLFFIEKLFINKKFLCLNGSLTIIATLLFLYTIFSKNFLPPPQPKSLPISFDEAPYLENLENLENLEITRLFLTIEEATNILNTSESTLRERSFLPQSYIINMAVLSQVTGNYKKADYYWKTARYIDPNISIFQ